MNQEKIDKDCMSEALAHAVKSGDLGEVPIGAVAAQDNKIIAFEHNLREKTDDPLGHAELLLLQRLAHEKKSWRLTDVTIYVTCEPCIMCAGAMLQARIPRLVYGCRDPKAGAVDSLYQLLTDPRLNHRVEVRGGVLEEECSQVLKRFFKGLR